MNGCGMKAARELKDFLDSKGFVTYYRNTTDHLWPYRKPRIVKDNLKYVVIVWAGKRGIRDNWRFLAVENKEGIEKIQDEIKTFRAYPYLSEIQ